MLTMAPSSPKKAKTGRPSKYKPEFCQEAINFMSQGFSIEALAGHLKITHDTVYRWEKEIPEFSEAMKEARSQYRTFWEKIGIAGMAGKIKGFNAAAWIFNMRNRFGWRNEVQINASIEHKVTQITKQDVLEAIGNDPFLEVEFKKEEESNDEED